MGQSTSSCFEDSNSDENNEQNSRNAFHPLSSQDAERTRFQQKAPPSEALTTNNTKHKNVGGNQQVALDANKGWKNVPSLQKEDKDMNPIFVNTVKGKDVSSSKYARKSEDVSSSLIDTKHRRQSKPKRIRLRWKNKDLSESSKWMSNGIMAVRDEPNQKTLYFFANESNKEDGIDANKFMYESSKNVDPSTSSFDATGMESTKTKLVIRGELEVKNAFLKKMATMNINNRGKKETFIEPMLVCGTQIYTKRVKVNRATFEGSSSSMVESIKAFTLPLAKASKVSSNSNTISVKDVNPDKIRTISNETLRDVLKKKRQVDKSGTSIQKEPRQGLFKGKKVLESHGATSPHIDQQAQKGDQKGELLSATVKDGIARKLFTPDAITESQVESVPEMICVCSENDIYVCDIGLTSSRCDFIVNTAERCSNGSYNAYTYAKQTLGCREYDELAVVCEWPVMRAVVSILDHLENTISPPTNLSESAPARSKRKRRTLVLDDREPHIVKYDISRKERQKLDMHTDKSEWTFLIALTDGTGDDYDGGGTYFECIDSTVHLEKGHALIFPGRLRHRGQKIISGKRFLLVGFLVEKHGESKRK